MPTYDYHCDACGHEFELFQSINDPIETTCPKCRKEKLRRLFGAGAAIVFKGSGFYQTDYRSESYKSKAKADKESSGGKEAGAKDSGSKESGAEGKSAAASKKPKAPKAD